MRLRNRRLHGERKPDLRPKTSADDAITTLFNRFMNRKRTEGLQPRTVRDYELHFRYLLDFLGDEDLRAGDMTTDLFLEYIAYMTEDREFTPHTVNLRVRTMRAFLRFCYEQGYVDEPIHAEFKPIKTPLDNVEAFTEGELQALLAQPDIDKYVGFRDFVIMCVLIDTMVRIGELLRIKRHFVDLKTRTIHLEASITKTKVARVVPLSEKTTKLVAEYLDETEPFNAEYFIVTYDGRPFHRDATKIRNNFREYGEQAGVRKRVSPHTFRHTGALLYIMNGGDPFSLQRILGHSSMQMVRRYVRMSGVDIQRKHDAHSPLRNIRW